MKVYLCKLLLPSISKSKENVKKIIPLDLEINQTIMGFMIADDGNYSNKNGLTISTHGFTKDEVKRLCISINILFSIYSIYATKNGCIT